MTDIRAMSRNELDELNARARQWHQRDNPSQEGAKAAEPLETELMTRQRAAT